MPDTPEDRLINGRYRLIEVIDQGAMGTVWRGHDEMLDRQVAIKQILLSPDLDEPDRAELKALAMQEARATARLNHPGVITLYDVIEYDGAPVIVMEFLKGRSLAALLRQQVRLPWRRVAEIGAAMVDALKEAQAAGIIHRDLKPANVLIAGQRIVITDFGIAQRVGERTSTDPGEVIGTPAFMAPEQAENAAASPAADLWSLGATLFNAVEGTPPYEGPDYATVLLLLLSQDPPEPRRAGPLRPLITSLLRRNPALRPTIDQVAEQLEALLHEDVHSGAPVPPPASPPPARPSPAASPPASPAASRPASRPTSHSASPSRARSRPLSAPSLTHVRPFPAAAPPVPIPPRRPRRRWRVLAGLSVVAFVASVFATRYVNDSQQAAAPNPPVGPPSSGSGAGPAGVDAVAPLLFSPDGRTLAVGERGNGSTPGAVELFDMNTRKRLAILRDVDGPDSLAFSPDGERLAVGGGDGTVAVWDVAAQKRTATTTLRPAGVDADKVTALVFDKDDKTLFTCDQSGQYGKWTVGHGKPVMRTIPGDDGAECVALSPDGGTLATYARESGRLALWQKLEGRLEPATLMTTNGQGAEPQAMVFSPDRRTFAAMRLDSAAHEGSMGPGKVDVWDVTTHEHLATHEVIGSADSTLTFSADGTSLAITTTDGGTDLWAFRDGDDVLRIPHSVSDEVRQAGFDPDRRHLATVGADGRIRLWDLTTLDQLTTWPAGG